MAKAVLRCVRIGLDSSVFCAANLTDDSRSGATQLLDGLITITDPQLFSDGSAKIRNTAVGAAITATGLAYSPCVIVAGPAGDTCNKIFALCIAAPCEGHTRGGIFLLWTEALHYSSSHAMHRSCGCDGSRKGTGNHSHRTPPQQPSSLVASLEAVGSPFHADAPGGEAGVQVLVVTLIFDYPSLTQCVC